MYRPEDLESIQQLEFELFPENAFNEYTLSKEIGLGYCLVVELGKMVVGYCLVRVDPYEKRSHILRLGISSGYRRMGWGESLLEEVLTRTPTYSAMLTVLKRNTPAIALYRKKGFTVRGGTPWDPDGMFLMERLP